MKYKNLKPKIKNYSKIIFENKKTGLFKIESHSKNKIRGEIICNNGTNFTGIWILTLNSEKKNIFVPYKGLWRCKNGNWFDGICMNNSYFNGNGYKKLKNGNIFSGEWKNGLFDNGKIIWNNGNYFFGKIKNNKPSDGFGKCQQKNGFYFLGEFKNGILFNGICKCISRDCKYIFEGSIKNGKFLNGLQKFVKDNLIIKVNNYTENFKNELSSLELLCNVAIDNKN